MNLNSRRETYEWVISAPNEIILSYVIIKDVRLLGVVSHPFTFVEEVVAGCKDYFKNSGRKSKMEGMENHRTSLRVFLLESSEPRLPKRRGTPFIYMCREL